MGVGYFQCCRPVTIESNPLRFLEPTPEIPSNFLEILETLGAELRLFCKGAHSCSCGEVTVETYCAVRPPSITNSDPVTNEASSEAR